jgi:2-haloacid dehalogenase
MPKSASFDVLGTCFSFDAAITTIQARLGPSLAAASVDAKSLFFSWFYAAQRDFTYASLLDHYTPLARILELSFRRACAVVDIPAGAAVRDADVAAVMAAMRGGLRPRDGLRECWEGLRADGWDVLGVTNGAVEASRKLFEEGAGVVLGEGDLVSCDALRVAKPDARVYAHAHRCLTERAGGGEEGGGERWFVAAHAWDLAAARKAGFKTAYLDFEEHDAVGEVFGEFDLYAKDMRELLEKLKAV